MSSVREYENEVWLRWTHEDVNSLKEMRELGVSIVECAKRLYVALCRAQGGFCAYSERRSHRGTPLLCGPITYPRGWDQ